jgi:Condensation domain
MATIATLDALRSGALTEAQREIWEIQDRAPLLPIQQMAYRIPVKGRLSTKLLLAALEAVVIRHEPLRTTYSNGERGPQADVRRPSFNDQIDIDVRGATVPDLAQQLFTDVATRPYDLGNVPLLRLVLLQHSDSFREIILGLHHLCADGWSLRNLGKDVSSAYNRLLNGELPAFRDLPVQAIDYAVWEAAWAETAQCRNSLEWWSRRLRPGGRSEQLTLPYLARRINVPYVRTMLQSDVLPAALAEKLSGHAKAMRISLFAVILAAIKHGLSSLTGHKDVVIATVAAARRMQNINLLGAYRNILAIRTRLPEAEDAPEIVRCVARSVFEALEHQYVPHRIVAGYLKREHNISFFDFLKLTFNWSDTPDTIGLKFERTDVEPELSWDQHHYTGGEKRDGASPKTWALRSATDLQMLGFREAGGSILLQYFFKSDLIDSNIVDALRMKIYRFLSTFADASAPT